MRMLGFRSCCLVLLAMAVVAVATTATASAATFSWYGASPDCWQTGPDPGAPSTACDFPGGGTLVNAISGDLNAAASGDYCNIYNAESTSCPNEGATWPLAFKTTATCSGGVPFCGIQHYVSLIGQNDQPWSSDWAAQPALVVSGELTVTKAKSPSSAWAYVCPSFRLPARLNISEIALTGGRAPLPSQTSKKHRHLRGAVTAWTLRALRSPWAVIPTALWTHSSHPTLSARQRRMARRCPARRTRSPEGRRRPKRSRSRSLGKVWKTRSIATTWRPTARVPRPLVSAANVNCRRKQISARTGWSASRTASRAYRKLRWQ